VAAYVVQDSKMRDRILKTEPDLCGELAYQRDHEMAIYPSDHWLRRTRLGLVHHELLQAPPPGIM